MKFRILGPMEVVDRGRPVEIGAAKERALLAVLVLHANHVVSRDRLIEVVWGENPPATAATTLNTYVSHLRAALEPNRGRRSEAQVLLTRQPGYLLVVDEDDEVDAVRFEHLLAHGRRALASGDAGAAAAALTEALSLWRGPALADFAYDAWAQADAARLEELRLVALEERVEADLAMGRHNEVIGEARRLVAEHPLRERLWSQLMTALYRSGRQSEALRAYGELRQALGDELGIDPSPQLRQLEDDILHQRSSLDAPPLSPSAVAAAPPEPGSRARRLASTSNLPTPLTSFVGREAEVAQVGELCRAARLVTLTGTGGMGKTRLALEVGRGALADHDGVFLVELAPLSDEDDLHQQVLSAMGVPEEPGRSPTETLVGVLADRRIMLVLDNCEHVVAPAAALVEELLSAGHGVRILATSREVLRTPAETVWRVPALSVPADAVENEEVAGSEAVRLFLERARTAAPQLNVPPAGVCLVAEICRRLDGIPLAIELAAARTRVLSLQDILDRLDDRFRLLGPGPRTGPDRHRTLRAVVDWSYQALPPAERSLFDRLSVFSGGFTLEAAEHVCSDAGLERSEILGMLSGLVDKSMAVVEHDPDTTRYVLLETLREYGMERLAASDEDGRVRDRHLAWATSLADQAASELDGGDQGRWLARLDAEHDNLRHGLARAEAVDRSSLLSMAASLGRFWEVRGFLTEGRHWLESALAEGQAPSGEATAKAHRWAGVLAQRQADYDAARRHYEAGLALSRQAHDQRGTASALHSLGNLEGLQGRLDRASALYEESLALGRALGDGRIVAASLTNLGWLAQTRSDFQRARRLTDDSVTVWRELGDRRGEAQALTALAYLGLLQGDAGMVRSRCEESLAIQRQLGDRYGEAWSLTYLGWAAQNEGDVASADDLHGEALAIRHELGDRYGEAWSLSHLGDVERARGDAERARALLDASLAIARELGDTYCIAWSLLRLGRLAATRDDRSTAERLFRQALSVAGMHGDKVALAASLEGLAQTSASDGRFDEAARFLRTAGLLRRRTGAPLPRAERAIHDRTVAAVRRVLGDEVFDAVPLQGWDDDSDEIVRELGLLPSEVP